MRTALRVAMVVVGVLSVGGVAVGADAASFDVPAVGEFSPGERRGGGNPRDCPTVVMVGDSLTAIRPTATIGAFRSIGVPIYVDAVSSRRVPADVPGRLSGVRTVTELLAAGNDAPCWIVALGSNDLLWVETPGQYGVDARSTVEAYLDMMVDAINSNNTSQQRPAPRVFWVNLNHHRRYGPEATLFNALLDARATTDASFSVIDWHTLSSANRGWFVDTVHVNAAGYDARAALVADAIAAANSSADN